MGIREREERNIKFALILKDGAEVRTIDELRNNFDVYEILESFISGHDDRNEESEGKLAEWLRDRYYNEKAKEIEELYKDFESGKRQEIQDIVKEICQILDVKWSAKIKSEIEEYKELNDKDGDIDEKLKKYHPSMRKIITLVKKARDINENTDDYKARINFRNVARNQKELEELIDQKKKIIYLLPMGKDRPYKIPDDVENICYIGVEDMDEELPRAMMVSDIKSRAYKILEEDEVKKKETIKFSRLIFLFPSPAKENSDEEKDLEFEGNRLWSNKINEKSEKELFGKNSAKEMRREENNEKTVQKRIIRCMDANFPLLYLNTFEEDKADKIICSVLGERKFFEWNAEGFFEREKTGKQTGYWREGWSLYDTLNFFIRDDMFQISSKAIEDGQNVNFALKKSVLVIKDAHHLLNDPKIIAQLKYLSQRIYQGTLVDCNIVIISPVLIIPKELEKYLTIMALDCLTEKEIGELLGNICKNNGLDPEKIKPNLRKRLISELKGLSEFDITNILSLAISVDKELNAGDFALIRDHKKQIIKKMNILEMIDVEVDKDDIGGLESLKEWLTNKEVIVKNPEKAAEYHVDIPKGVMIAGMPGCGKSITAKVTADMFNLPLLRMDIGKIMGKYVGESEAKMHQALRLAQSVAPCVLWIDEIEKAFSGINGDGGGTEVTTRLFGIFLTWMQEKKAAVFVVATANDATRLPPELLRKGRFDEIFYVGFPNKNERRRIFDIHFEKRGKKKEWDDFKEKDEQKNLRKLLRKTSGYSGADIEGVVRETIEMDFIENVIKGSKDKKEIGTILFEVIDKTTPLKKTMSGTLNGLIRIYKEGRFRNASNGKGGDGDLDNTAGEGRFGEMKLKWRDIKEDVNDKWIGFKKTLKGGLKKGGTYEEEKYDNK